MGKFSIWHESARNIQTWGKCYLPGWIFNDDAAISLNQSKFSYAHSSGL